MSNGIGERIRKRRKELKLNQKDIASYTGISQGNLSSIENNLFLPSTPALISLSKILQCSIDFIVNGEEYKKEETYQNYQEFTEEEKKLILKMRALKNSDIDFIKDIIDTRYEKTIKERKEKFSNPEELHEERGEIIA